ncbi:MAG: chromate transporter [Acutalibacteraceae bacterium]|nr:chromate transporter [Acutalibacteraceae bacterium]
MKTLIEMFLIFARIGGFTFGGGYAMLPMLQREVVENKKWATQEELMDYYAIGQCTPGIIAVNVATFVGYKEKGFFGAVFSTLGVITPSVIIVGIIAMFISNFQDYEIVQYAFSGIRAAVVALIASSVIKLFKKSVIDGVTGIIFIAITLLSFLTDISPIIFIVISGVIGLCCKLIKAKAVSDKVKKEKGDE